MAVRVSELGEFFQQQNFLRPYDKGALICNQGEPFDYVFMVNSGMVKCYDIDDNGSERAIAIFSHYSAFPLTWLLREPPAGHLYFYDAFTEASVWMARREDVEQFVTGSAEV